jgi:MoaA/NifB/PqqE/SkfB family radical SAM enzyme
MGLSAIDDKTEKQLMVIWDLGRRCTFACSYCPPHRKNNWSDTASLESLIATADNLERYSEIYNAKRNERFRVAASFTGGEPTVNPAFFSFLEYLQVNYPHWKRTLTTNGFYSERKLRTVMANTHSTTVSWHCEGKAVQKERVRKNLKIMNDEGYSFKINIMFHEQDDYFQECIELAMWCDDNSVSYTPRVIGDQGDIKKGIKNNTVHKYTEEQYDWLKRYWAALKKDDSTPAYTASAVVPATIHIINIDADQSPKEKKVGQKMGRPCCGGRKMDLQHDSEWSVSTFVENNNFKGWSCMINWYFLYIHQEIDKIWHHQTCQVTLEGEVGPISTVSKFDEYCDSLEEKMNTGSMPYIRCPKSHCGCGLCAPKAKNDEMAVEIFKRHAPGIEPEFMERKEIEQDIGSLKNLVYKFDEKNGNETI